MKFFKMFNTGELGRKGKWGHLPSRVFKMNFAPMAVVDS